MKAKLILSLLVAFWTSAISAHTIFLSPSGKDTNDGRAISRPFATLQRALDQATEQASEGSEIVVQIQPGRYIGQSAVTLARPDGVSIKITSASKNRPEFVGDPARKLTWLHLKSASGQPTRLTISGLLIRGYAMAISLEGDRNNARASNSKNTIQNNFFKDIGSGPDAGKNISTAAIRLVNSKSNLIANNQFEDIRNAEDCSVLHAIYAAHFSSNNVIRNNRFSNLCGSAIKLRDRSNFNTIENNLFNRLQSVPAVEEWFCDKSARQDCTKRLGECPSTGTHLLNNKLNNSANSKLVNIIGNREPRSWCAASDFATERIR